MIEANGSFEVSMAPIAPPRADNIARMSLDKTYTGDLKGAGKGEMMSAGNPATGNAGYVAIERIDAVLQGKRGTFAVMQIATMATGNAPRLEALIVPGSGTRELAGISGTLKIIIDGQQHLYQLEYRIN